jgi:phospholipid/cholesterol/gamma-HCH transport system substrate-binding protein
MSTRVRRGRGPIVKLSIFLVLSGLIATYLAVVLGNISFTSTNSYHAIFANVSGLKADSPVRIAGVDVGTVDAVEIYHGDDVKVDFSVDTTVTLSRETHATVRYKNLIGDRYLELSAGNTTGDILPGGSTIPLTQTAPALDLDTLLNGFKPLFVGLDPNQINAVSMAFIRVFQGESGTVTSLLTMVASLTSTLAGRDKLIGDVIHNLDASLRIVAARGSDLDTLIVQMQQLISGLSADRNPIADAIVHINGLTASASQLLTTVRPDLREDVAKLGSLAKSLDDGSDTITYTLHRLPRVYQVLARLGAYGNFFNFYLCETQERITLPNGATYLTQPSKNPAARCK